MKHNARRSPIILIALSVLTISATAQIAGGLNETVNTGLGGNNFIVGTVFWPSGTPVNTRMRIRLVPHAGGEIISSTDDSGKFVFSRVAAGSYSVVIDGENDFETVRREVDIERSRNPIPQTYTVTIRLVDRAKSQIKPGVLSIQGHTIPKRAQDLYEKALDLSAAKDHKEAIKQLRLAIAEHQPYIDAHNELGVQYMRINELEKAVEALQEALKIKADAFEPLLNHGIALFRLKRYDEAEKQLRLSMGSKADSAIAHYYLGRCLTSIDRFDEAEKALNEALRLGGAEMNEAYRMMANLYIAKGDDKRAVEALENYLKLVPQAPDAAKLRDVIRQLTPPK